MKQCDLLTEKEYNEFCAWYTGEEIGCYTKQTSVFVPQDKEGFIKYLQSFEEFRALSKRYKTLKQKLGR